MRRPTSGKRERAHEESTRRKFADRMTAELRRAGVVDKIEYDEKHFRLVCGAYELNLQDAFAGWRQASVMQRENVFRRYVTEVRTTRDALLASSDNARRNFLPHVRDLEWYEIASLRGEGSAHTFRTLNEHLAVGVVYSQPRSMLSIGPEMLDHWGISRDEALDTAIANLRDITTETLARVEPGVYASVWHDDFDASRLLLPEKMSGLDVRGDPVAVLPHPNGVLVTGSDDQAGLAILAEQTGSLLDDPSFVTGRAFVWRDGAWQAFLPPEGDPQRGSFRRLAWRTETRDYRRQKPALEDHHDAVGANVYVASLLVGEDPGTDAGLTTCTWSAGTRSLLLPRADDVAFVSSDHAYDTTYNVLVVPWNDAARIMGAAMRPQGLRPERWLVERFPNTDELAALEQHATDPAVFHSGAAHAGTPTNRSL